MTNYDANGNILTDAQWYAYHAANVAATGQIGSQYWMNASYNLNASTEPTTAQKAYADQASVAYAYAQSVAQDAVVQYGVSAVNPTIATLAAQTQTSTATLPSSVADIMSALSPWTTWLSQNILLVVIVVVLAIAGPGLIRSATGGRA